MFMGAAAASFTPSEAAALLDLPERQIRKEFEHGLVKTGARPRLQLAGLVYLHAVHLMEFDLGVGDRRKVLKAVRGALASRTKTGDVPLTSVLTLRLGPVVRDVESKVKAFTSWKKKLVSSPEILGGEPVFPGSRLAVRHIGAMVDRGEPLDLILEDYPYLKARDLTFARTFARAYPRAGRPRATRQAAAR